MLRVCSLGDKRIGPYTYVYLVENVREEGRTKQRIIANLGRKEVVVAAVISTGWRAPSPGWRSVRWCCRWSRGEARRNARCQRIGPPLLFERLWHEIGCRAVLEELRRTRHSSLLSSARYS